MKKYKFFVVLFLSLVMVSVSYARSFDEARKIAMDFYGVKSPLKLASAAKLDAEACQPYYIFNSPDQSQFVVVSGNDDMPEILGYSDSGAYDENAVPPQFEWLLSLYEYAESYDGKAPSSREEHTVLLNTANYDQHYPYNELCPQNAVTGCTATAMAILMQYYEWPPKGRGSYSYEMNGQTLSMNFDYDFNWNKILDDYSFGSTSGEKEAVAKLMYSCGVSVATQYTKDNSAAYVNNAVVAMPKYFYYSPEITYVRKNEYGEGWDKMLRDELDAGRPMIYNGSDTRNNYAHAFVLDGYRGDYFHFNWGWNGSCNGFFLLTNMNTGSGGGYVFNDLQGAVVHIAPDKSMSPFCPLNVIWMYDENYGLSYNRSNVLANDKFLAIVRSLNNCDNEPASGELALALTDAEGNVKTIIAKGAVELPLSSYYPILNFDNAQSSVSAVEGDMLALLFKRAGSEEWLYISSDGFVPSKVAAYGYEPKMVPISWDLDSRFTKTIFNQGEKEALLESNYTFAVKKRNQSGVETFSVTVNGTPLDYYTIYNNWYYYDFPVESKEGYEIVCKGYPEQSGVEDIEDTPCSMFVSGRTVSFINYEGECWEVYNQYGVLVKEGNASQFTLDAAGVYIVRVGAITQKIIIR